MVDQFWRTSGVIHGVVENPAGANQNILHGYMTFVYSKNGIECGIA